MLGERSERRKAAAACVVALFALQAAPEQTTELPPDPPDRIGVTPSGDGLQLQWSDAEDRLLGAIGPKAPQAGRAMRVSVHIAPFHGAPFEGPVTLTLRRDGERHGESFTVPLGDRTWAATFLPDAAGPHHLDVAFRSTRLKLLHARIDVAESPLSRAPWIALIAAAALAAIAYGVHVVAKSRAAE